MEEGQGAGLFLRGDCWSLWELACKGIGASVIKEAEKMGWGRGGGVRVILHEFTVAYGCQARSAAFHTGSK